jgi:hypothetical protein
MIEDMFCASHQKTQRTKSSPLFYATHRDTKTQKHKTTTIIGGPWCCQQVLVIGANNNPSHPSIQQTSTPCTPSFSKPGQFLVSRAAAINNAFLWASCLFLLFLKIRVLINTVLWASHLFLILLFLKSRTRTSKLHGVRSIKSLPPLFSRKWTFPNSSIIKGNLLLQTSSILRHSSRWCSSLQEECCF